MADDMRTRVPLAAPALVGWIVRTFEGEDLVTEDPIDAGGLTIGGITYKTWRWWKLAHGADAKVCRVGEFRATSRAERIACGVEVFAEAPGITTLGDVRVQFATLDYAFHAGWVPAIRSLQCVLDVQVDGVIGPATRLAIMGSNATYVAAALCAHRADRMLDLIRQNRTQLRFLEGWMVRVVTVLGIVTDAQVPGRAELDLFGGLA